MARKFKIQDSKSKIFENWKLEIRNYSTKEFGFTLTELVITIAIITTLFSLTTINVSYSQRHASVTATVNTLISDLKEQQIKALVGDTEGRGVSANYGIYIKNNEYVLFHGNTYNAADSSNRTISLESTLQFVNPNYSLLFSRITGDVSGYNPLLNTITLKDTTNNEQKVIQFNKHGVIISVN